jgi:hypothetical protein
VVFLRPMTTPNFFPPPYQPQAPHVTGPAFGPVFRACATGLVFALVIWGARVVTQNGLDAVDPTLLSWVLAGLGLVLVMGWTMVRSTTTLTTESLSQTWFWKKSTPLADIGYAKFMRFKGLEWLIAPRLYVRTGHGPFKTYHAGHPALWEAFEAMAAHFEPYKR